MGSVSCGATPSQAHTCVEEDVHSDVSSLVETAPAAGAAVPLGTFTKDPGHTMLAAAAVASPEGGYGFVADAAIMYTKLMWLSHRSPEFIHQLLAYRPVEDAWMASMRTALVLGKAL